MILAGVVMLFSKNIGISTSKIVLPLLLLLSGFTTFKFALVNEQNKTASIFHKIQGGLFIVFSALVIFAPDSLKSFLLYFTYFCLCYGLIEIMFSFAMLSSKVAIKKKEYGNVSFHKWFCKCYWCYSFVTYCAFR